MTEASQDIALVDGLLCPEAYPWQPASVELVQTHVSWVFLAGERVVKVKKPVGYGFVDHTTLESRRRSCADEVRLNRRLTDGVYLDVAPIVRDGTGYRVAAEGEPVEWATLMHRLPADKMLDVLGRRYGRRTASCERSRSSPGERRKKALARRWPPTLADPQPDHGKVSSKRHVRAKLEGAGTPGPTRHLRANPASHVRRTIYSEVLEGSLAKQFKRAKPLPV